MRNTLCVCLIAIVSCMSGCAVDSSQHADAASAQIIGDWKSEPMETEIGPGHIHCTFTDEGLYTIHFETDLLRFGSRRGAFTVEGNRLITIVNNQPVVSPFWFEDDDVLVIPDGSKIVRLNRT